MDVTPGTIVVWGDIACPWATLAVHRLHEARRRAGREAEVRLDLRSFPLELVNGRPTPKPVLEAEIPVVGALAPDLGLQLWTGEPWTWPGSVLLALEAVQAAKTQSLVASEQLDLGLRRAMFAESRHVGILATILDVAKRCPALDSYALEDALRDGRARATVMEQWRVAEGDEVKGSPHVFLADGTEMENPGITMHWEGPKPGGFPVVDDDEPSVYDDLVKRA